MYAFQHKNAKEYNVWRVGKFLESFKFNLSIIYETNRATTIIL